MGTSPLGRTLVIANPAANRGEGAEGAAFVQRFLDSYRGATTSHKVILTKAAGDAQNLARRPGTSTRHCPWWRWRYHK